MSLVVWLPFNNAINNQGTGGGTFTGTPSYYTTGKVTRYCLSSGDITMPSSITSKVFNKDAVSVAFWLYNGGATGCIFGTEGMTHPNNRRFTLFQYPNATDLHWSWQNEDSDGTFTSGVASGVITSNAWSHICAVWDNGTARIYVNGVQVGTSTGTCTTTSWSYDTIIARASASRYYNDLRIYNHALSVKEVKELAKGLALHYKFNFEDLYVPIEYIEGTGTQYINTGFVDTPNTKVQVDMQFTTKSPTQQRLFGHGYDSDTGSNVSFEAYINGSQQWARATSNGVGNWQSTGVSVSTAYRYIFTLDNSTFKITTTDGNLIYKDLNSATITRTNTTELFLMTRTNPSSTDFNARAKLYGCKIWDNDKLVRNFIPCARKCDSKPGLFDLVTYNFYTNAGSGEFSYPTTNTIKQIPDTSGYGLVGTLCGSYATYSSPIGNACMGFNGTDTYIDIGYILKNIFYDSISSSTPPFTISFWVYNNESDSGTGRGVLFGNYLSSNTNIFNVEINGGSTSKALRVYWAGSPDYTATHCILDYQTWVNVGIVYNGNSLKVYKNGSLVDTYSGTLSAMTSVNMYRIGNDLRSGGQYFQGAFGDFRLYATALSDADIVEIYKTRESIDKKGNLYCNSINELGNSMSFKKNNVIDCNSIKEGGSKTSLQGAYTQLEYIESSGTQYIDTGFKHNTSTTKYEMKIETTSLPNTYHSPFGSRTDHNSTDAYYFGIHSDKHTYGCIGGNKKDPLGWTLIGTTGYVYTVILEPTKGLTESNLIYSTFFYAMPYTTSVTSTLNDYIFAGNWAGGVGEVWYGRVYYFKIWDGNTLVRDYIPVKRNKDGVLGLFDLVNNVFYTNAGSGSFIAGDEINKKYSIYTNNIIEN